MATFPRKAGDTFDAGSEAMHRESRRRTGGDRMLVDSLDGEVTMRESTSYFPLHKGMKGSRPGFSDDAHHVVRIVAVADDGTTTNECACGAGWTYTQDPE